MTRLHVIHNPRQCGQCSACCVALPVRQLDKPAGEPCAKLEGSRCGAYNARPHVCRTFSCAWLAGLYDLTEAQRPDLCGVIVWATDKRALKVSETWIGAASQRRGLAVIDQVSKNRHVPVEVYRL